MDTQDQAELAIRAQVEVCILGLGADFTLGLVAECIRDQEVVFIQDLAAGYIQAQEEEFIPAHRLMIKVHIMVLGVHVLLELKQKIG